MIGDVDLVELETRASVQALKAIMLQLHRIIIVETVDADHADAGIKQLSCHVIPDEAGGAGQQDGLWTVVSHAGAIV